MTDSYNDAGPPFDPETPDEFAANAIDEFNNWWDDLDVPGSLNGVSLDHDTARVVWKGACDHVRNDVEIIYDNARAHSELARNKYLTELAFVASRFLGGSVTYRVDELIEWLGENEEHIKRDYQDGVITVHSRH